MIDANSMSVADADSIIDTALLDANSPIANSDIGAGTGTGTLLPSIPLSADEEADSEEQPLSADEEKIRQAQDNMLGQEEAEKQRREQAEIAAKEATLLGVATAYMKSAKRGADKANIRIGDIPKPTGIGVPLVMLLIFFFALITFAGKSRLQWLWYVLTNNAYVTASQSLATGIVAPTVPTIPTGSGPSALFNPFNSRASGMGGNPYS